MFFSAKLNERSMHVFKLCLWFSMFSNFLELPEGLFCTLVDFSDYPVTLLIQ